jgi:protein SCO1/2
VFITIDPERDGVKEMAAYVPNFSKHLVGLTGTPQEIAAIAKAYRAYYAKVREKGSDDNEYAMDHSAIVYLMDRKGRYASHFAYGITPEKMAARIRTILTK